MSDVRSTISRTDDGVVVLHEGVYGDRAWRTDGSFKVIVAPTGVYGLETRTSEVRLHSGRFVVLNPNVEHRHVLLRGQKLLVELAPHVVAEAAEAVGWRRPRFVQTPSAAPAVRAWAAFVLDELCLNRDGWELAVSHAVPQLALLLVRLDRNVPVAHAPRSIARAVDAINERYREPLTLSQLAAEAGMDRFAFAHAFARTVGISPHQALIRRRLSVAEERLIASDDTILAVALDSGFGSLSSFNRAFRRAYGVTPRVFRLRAR